MRRELDMMRFSRRAVCQAPVLAVAMGLAGVPARAQGGTPVAAPASGGMQAMLGLVPASLPGLDDLSQATIAWADIAAQLDAVGTTPPPAMDAAEFQVWAAATRFLPMPSHAAQYLIDWRADYGFDLLQADQTMWVALPPFDLSLFRGRFDTDAVLGALDALGYAPVEVGGHELRSIRGDNEIAMDAPTTYRMAAMNFAAMLPDGTLAFASAGAPLAAVLDVAAGAAPSMLEIAGVGLLLDQAPPGLASAMLVQGVALAGSIPPSFLNLDPGATPDISAIATEMAETSELPPVAMALLGATTGGPLLADEDLPLPPDIPDARAVAVALMLDPASAEAAVPIIDERLATGTSARTLEPLTTLFPDWEVRAIEGAPVVVVDLALGESTAPNILVNMLLHRDLGFLAW
jgi:hypothetical protein